MQHPQIPDVPFTRTEATALGISPHVLARLLRDGLVLRERHGLFMDADVSASWTPRWRHLQIATAVAARLRGGYALGAVSAAAWHDLPTPWAWPEPLPRVCLYALGNDNAAIRRNLHVLVTPLPPDELLCDSGIAVTTLTRTAIDIARHCPLPRALIPIDGALRAGIAREELLEQARRQRRWPGTRMLLPTIAVASPLSESALESFSLGTFHVHGIPRPEQQVWVQGGSGREYRADFLWPGARLIGEADGWGKQGSSAEEWRRNLAQEKVREDDLRDAGYRVIRWTFSTLDDKLPLIARRTHIRPSGSTRAH